MNLRNLIKTTPFVVFNNLDHKINLSFSCFFNITLNGLKKQSILNSSNIGATVKYRILV